MIQPSSSSYPRDHVANLPTNYNKANTSLPTGSSSSSPSSIVSLSSQALALADTSAPKVTRFAPRDGQRDVLISSNISVTFSETVRAGTGNIYLRDESGNLIESFDVANSNRISIKGKQLKIDPTDKLANGTRYFVSFGAGTITDLAGNVFQDRGGYDFTTVKEKVAPKVVSFFPSDGTTGVSPSQNIYVTFSENIKRGNGEILLKDSKGKIVERYKAQSSGNISISGNMLVINPGVTLGTDKKYVVEFGAGSIKDLADNKFKGSKSYDFKTATTDIPATVPASAPENTDPTTHFNITVDYTGDQSYLTYFDQAKTLWESIITADLPDINGIDDLQISAQVNAIDGAGGVLGSAGPTFVRSGSNLPYQGQMQFDSADIAGMVSNGTLLKVILHEMGHVLGLGTLWSTFGFNSTVGQYTGAQGLAAYKAMSGGNPAATFVPLETTGGAGTANVHWSESVFNSELMTGYAENSSNMPLSILTISALDDLGYEVDTSQAESYTVGA